MTKSSISFQVRNYLAFCIDGTYLAFLGGYLYFIILACAELAFHNSALWVLYFLTSDISAIFYYLFLISFNAMIQEIFFGTTIGKKVLGLVVTNDQYQKPTIRQIIIRNLVYPLDTLFVIGSFLLLKGNGKTLGGYISKTRLVNKKALKEIENNK